MKPLTMVKALTALVGRMRCPECGNDFKEGDRYRFGWFTMRHADCDPTLGEDFVIWPITPMAKRAGFVVRVNNPAKASHSLLRFGNLVTVEVRCNWPEPASEEEVLAALGQAFDESADRYREWGGDA